MPGGRLTSEDRQQIAAGLAEGHGYARIGRRLRRPASTIMREVARNGGPEDYRADRAQRATRHRARRRRQAQPAEPWNPNRGNFDRDHGRDPQAIQEFTESFTALLIQQGVPRMEARVQACLLTTDTGTLTAAELVQRLRVSPASISHAVGYLEQQGMLRRERHQGERRERYVIDDESWLHSLNATLRMGEALAAASQHGAELLGITTPAGARFDSFADLLVLVNESLTQVVERWRRNQAGTTSTGAISTTAMSTAAIPDATTSATNARPSRRRR